MPGIGHQACSSQNFRTSGLNKYSPSPVRLVNKYSPSPVRLVNKYSPSPVSLVSRFHGFGRRRSVLLHSPHPHIDCPSDCPAHLTAVYVRAAVRSSLSPVRSSLSLSLRSAAPSLRSAALSLSPSSPHPRSSCRLSCARASSPSPHPRSHCRSLHSVLPIVPRLCSDQLTWIRLAARGPPLPAPLSCPPALHGRAGRRALDLQFHSPNGYVWEGVAGLPLRES